MPDFANYVQPAHYNRSDGAQTCGHHIPVGPGACAECHSLTDEHWATGCTCTTPTTPDQTPAQQLHAAAQVLRNVATAARYEMKTGSYWRGLDPTTAWERGITNAVGGHAGALAALMSPEAALALADWLEHTAEFLADVQLLHGQVTKTALHNARHALAVARQILGSPS